MSLAVVALILGACSNDGSSGSGAEAARDAVATDAGDPPAAGGYAGGFDAVTRGFRARSEDLQARVDPSTSDAAQVIGIYEELRDIAADARRDYGALAPPAPVQPVHQRILQLFDRQVELLEDVVAAARANDEAAITTAIQELVDLTSEFDQARRQMQQAIAQCGQRCTS